MEEKVTIGEKEYTVKEIKYKDVAGLGKIEPEESAKQIMLISTDITVEEYDNLSMKDGIKLQKVINEINGLDGKDFQQPLTQ